MKRLVLVLLVFSALLGLPSAASASRWRHCGNQPRPGAGWYHVRALNIGCGAARTVAHRFTYSGEDPAGGWSCNTKPLAIEAERVACYRLVRYRPQLVHFSVGA